MADAWCPRTPLRIRGHGLAQREWQLGADLTGSYARLESYRRDLIIKVRFHHRHRDDRLLPSQINEILQGRLVTNIDDNKIVAGRQPAPEPGAFVI